MISQNTSVATKKVDAHMQVMETKLKVIREAYEDLNSKYNKAVEDLEAASLAASMDAQDLDGGLDVSVLDDSSSLSPQDN